jgi:hypothetical protein
LLSTQPLDVDPHIKTIVFSSPNIGHFKDYAKLPTLSVHFVPAWELHEIRAAFDLYFGKAFSLKWDDVFDLFCKWGGLPRFVFLDTAKSIQLLNSALNGCNIKSLMETVMQNSNFLGFNEITASNVRTKLIHFEVSQGSVKPTFGSSYIRDELLNLSKVDFHGFYSDFLKSHGASSYAAAVRGTLYEKCVLDYLSCQEINIPSFNIKSNQPRPPKSQKGYGTSAVVLTHPSRVGSGQASPRAARSWSAAASARCRRRWAASIGGSRRSAAAMPRP